MEVLENKLDNPLITRLVALKNLELYIEESIYYRTHTSEFKSDKIVVWTYGQDSRKTKVL
jgi:hypothetical protein